MANKPIKAPEHSGGDFETAPEGTFLARCYKMVDVGTQTESGQYGTKENRKVYFYWELLKDADGKKPLMADGKSVFSIMNGYTLSMHAKANLRKHLNSWRGKPFTEEQAKGFDITKLLDKFCMLQIVHNESKDGTKTYANIDAIMSTKDKAKGENDVVSFSIEDPDTEVFNDLPEWLQNKIQDAPEWNNSGAEEPAESNQEELADDEVDLADVPF